MANGGYKDIRDKKYYRNVIEFTKQRRVFVTP